MKTICEREIKEDCLGIGCRHAAFIGTVMGTEQITGELMERFCGEYREIYKKRGNAYGISIPYLYNTRQLLCLPFANPDGVVTAAQGGSGCCPEYEKLREILKHKEPYILLLSVRLGDTAVQWLGEGEPDMAQTGIGEALARLTEGQFCGKPLCRESPLCRERAKNVSRETFLPRVAGEGANTLQFSETVTPPCCSDAVTPGQEDLFLGDFGNAYRVGIGGAEAGKERLYRCLRRLLFTAPILSCGTAGQ